MIYGEYPLIYGEYPFRRTPENRWLGENDRRGLSEWRKIWAGGVPNESRSPNSGRQRGYSPLGAGTVV